jgi:hypothetical protein
MTVHKALYEEVLTTIFALNLERCDVAVCLSSVQQDANSSQHETALSLPQFMVLDLSRNLTDTFRNIVIDVLEEYAKEYHQNNIEVREYATESKPDAYQIEHLDITDHDSILKQIEPLVALQDMETFDENEHFVHGLRFYVIRIKPLNDADGALYFYRSYTSKKLLSQSPFFAVWRGQYEYDRVDQPVFLFDRHIDCFSLGKDLFILKKDNFHHIFRFLEAVKRVAQETLEIIEMSVPIQNFEQFALDCQRHPLKMAKLKNIAQKSYLRMLNIDKIKKVIEKYELKKQGVEIVTVNDKQMLLYDARKPWMLLKLLDDDYLWSEMTEQGYEVTEKREM